MPVESTINSSERLVLTRSWDVVTFEEVVAHQNGLLANQEFNPDYDQLGVHLDAESLAGTAQQWASIARLKVFSATSFRAHVASKDVIFGLLRLMATHHELEHQDENVVTFRDEESARKWLSQMRAKRDTGAI